MRDPSHHRQFALKLRPRAQNLPQHKPSLGVHLHFLAVIARHIQVILHCLVTHAVFLQPRLVLFPFVERPNLCALTVRGRHVKVCNVRGVQQLLEGHGHLEPPALLDLRWMVATEHLPASMPSASFDFPAVAPAFWPVRVSQAGSPAAFASGNSIRGHPKEYTFSGNASTWENPLFGSDGSLA